MSGFSLPCRVGDTIADIDTPALVVNLDKLERNLQKMSKTMNQYPEVRLRPHTKTHKCPILSHWQLFHGAVGMCCQTLSEAEAMVEGGVLDVFISNQVIGKRKLLRLASLAKTAKISVCVDSEPNLRDASWAAGQFAVSLDVVVEVNVGGDASTSRCGTPPGSPAADLAKLVTELPHVTFKGIQGYNGFNQHVRKTQDRKKCVSDVVEKIKLTLEALSAKGIKCHYITGGGTGTFHFEAASGVYTEVQPGSYLMMDADYGRNLGEDGQPFTEFEQSLYVLSTVQSVTPGMRAVVDAGMKACSLDSGVPLLRDYPDLIYHNGGDEHGIVKPSGNLKVTATVRNYCSPSPVSGTTTLNSDIPGWRSCVVDSRSL